MLFLTQSFMTTHLPFGYPSRFAPTDVDLRFTSLIRKSVKIILSVRMSLTPLSVEGKSRFSRFSKWNILGYQSIDLHHKAFPRQFHQLHRATLLSCIKCLPHFLNSERTQMNDAQSTEWCSRWGFRLSKLSVVMRHDDKHGRKAHNLTNKSKRHFNSWSKMMIDRGLK